MEPRLFLRHTFDAALKAALPEYCVPDHLPDESDLPSGRIIVVGAGKASAAMAAALEKHAKQHWPKRYAHLSGFVITRYGHAVPCERINIVEAAHPVPDEAGYQAASYLRHHVVHQLTDQDLVIALISGGGSSLLTLPAEGVSLEDKQTINQALLSCGASISEMNCVRKHLSAIKGGHLALACYPAQILTLLISDVPGDDPSVIASGPTLADHTTCADAWAILQRYQLPIRDAIKQKLSTSLLETPKPTHPAFRKNIIKMIATPKMSLEASAAYAHSQGISAHILADRIEGEAHDIALMHAALADYVSQYDQPFHKPCLILSGGETTVTLRHKNNGRGGRNVTFLLEFAQALAKDTHVYALAADTDGIDGNCDIAGALIDPNTLERAAEKGISWQESLMHNDAHHFFERLGDSVITGPTYTNVNDFRAILIQGR